MKEAMKAVLAFWVLGGVGGCASATEDVAPDGVAEVQEVEQPLGESGCATATRDYGASSCPSNGYYGATSPDSTYDHGSGCPDQWITEITGTDGADVVPAWSWQRSTPTTQAACDQSRIEIGVYGDGSLDTTHTVNGSWGGNPPRCTFAPSTGNLYSNTTYDVFRVVCRQVNNGTKVITDCGATVSGCP